MKIIVKTPICSFCARTGILCANCRLKKREGEISDLEIDLSKLFIKLEKKYSHLQKAKKAKLHTAYVLDEEILLLIVNKDLKKALTEPIKEQIESLVNLPFLLVVKCKNIKDTLVSLFEPLDIIGIDQVYIPNLGQELRIRIKGDSKDLQFGKDKIIKIAERMAKASVRLEFDEEETIKVI